MNSKEAREALNKLYAEHYTEEEALEDLGYLSDKDRGNRVVKNFIRICYRKKTLGDLLAKLDPVAFSKYYNDKKPPMRRLF